MLLVEREHEPAILQYPPQHLLCPALDEGHLPLCDGAQGTLVDVERAHPGALIRERHGEGKPDVAEPADDHDVVLLHDGILPPRRWRMKASESSMM